MPIGKIIITNDTGEQVEATAPVIVSASRSTDIPAFYAKWSTAWLKGIVLGIIRSTSRKCIFRSKTARW